MSRTDEDSRQFPCIISVERPSSFIFHFLGPMIQHFKHWNVISAILIGAEVDYTPPIWHTAKKNVRVDKRINKLRITYMK